MAEAVPMDAASEAAATNLSHAAELMPMGNEAGHGASTEAHGGAVAHASPAALGMDGTGWVALAMIAVIAIMVWKKVPAVIGGALDRKIAGIREQLETATRLRDEAEALKAEYEAKAAAAEAEAAQIVAHANEEAAQMLVDAKADAEALIQRRTRMAEDKIAAAERAAVAEIRAKAASAAAAAAASLIAENHGADADRALIDRTISRLN